MTAVRYFQLAVYGCHAVSNIVIGQKKPMGNLAIRQPFGCERQYFHFRVGQPLKVGDYGVTFHIDLYVLRPSISTLPHQ